MGYLIIVYRLNKVQTVILWQLHCALRVVRTTAYLKAIMEVYGKTVTGLGPSILARPDDTSSRPLAIAPFASWVTSDIWLVVTELK